MRAVWKGKDFCLQVVQPGCLAWEIYGSGFDFCRLRAHSQNFVTLRRDWNSSDVLLPEILKQAGPRSGIFNQQGRTIALPFTIDVDDL